MSDLYSSKTIPGFRQPPLMVEMLKCIGGLALILLTTTGIIYNYSVISEFFSERAFPELQHQLEMLFDRRAGSSRSPVRFETIALSYLVSYVVFVLVIASTAWAAMSTGLKMVFRPLINLRINPYITPNLPKNFRSVQRLAAQLKSKTVETDGSPGSHDKFLLMLFGPTVRFVTPAQSDLVQRTGTKLRGRIASIISTCLFFGAIFAAINWLSTPSAGQLLTRETATLAIRFIAVDGALALLATPFIAYVAYFVACGISEYIFISLLVPRTAPATVSDEGSDTFQMTGTPSHIVNQLSVIADRLKWNDFKNRVLIESFSEAKLQSVGDTGDFSATIMIEQQPRPVGGYGRLGAFFWLLFGWLFVMAGTYIAMFLLRPAFFSFDWADAAGNPLNLVWTPLFILTMGFVARRSWTRGQRLIAEADELFRSCWFHSLAVLLEFSGTMNRADLRVGRSSEDAIEAATQLVRSEFLMNAYCAEIVSEAVDLESEREVLALQQTDQTRGWVEFFRTNIHELCAKGMRTPAVDIDSEEIGNLMKANIGASAQRSAEAEMAKLQATHAFENETKQLETNETRQLEHAAPNEDGSETAYMDCPDCGEPIRRVARKCRFCGLTFDQPQHPADP